MFNRPDGKIGDLALEDATTVDCRRYLRRSDWLPPLDEV
jgi:hypothetical protein